MADRQLYIEIVVDDKGAVSKLAQVDKGLKTVGTSGGSAGKGLNDFEQKVMRASAAGAFLADTAYDLANRALSAVTAAIGKSVSVASSFQATFTGLSTVAKAFGQDVGATTAAAQMLASDGLMTVQEAAAGLKNLLGAGFGLPEAIQLMTGFKDIAAFNRQASLEFGYAVVSATEGIKNQNSILVDNAGLTKNLSVILKEQGLAMSDLSKMSTDVGIKQKFLGGLMKEMAFATGDAARMADTYSGSLSRKNTQLALLRKDVGEKLMPVFAAWNTVVEKAVSIARMAPNVFIALAAAVTLLAGAVASYGAWAIYGETVMKVGIALKALVPSFATVQAAAVAATGSISVLAVTFMGLATAIGIAAIAATKWHESRKEQQLRDMEQAAVQDTINRAIAKGADANIKYADAIEFLKRKHLEHQVAQKAGTATQRQLADAQLRAGEITRAQYDDTIILIEAEERRKRGMENTKSLNETLKASANRYRDELRATGLTVEQLTAAMKKDEKATKDWLEAIGVSKDVIDKLSDNIDANAKALGERTKALEKATEAQREFNEEQFRSMAALQATQELIPGGLPRILDIENRSGVLPPMPGVSVGGANDPIFGRTGRDDLPDWMKRENMGIFDRPTPAVGFGHQVLGSGISAGLGALMGGGNVGASIGGAIGQTVAGKIGEGIASKVAAGTIGKALGSVLGAAVPIVGPLLGSIGGKLVGKLFGGLFGGGEKKKVQEALGKMFESVGGKDKFLDIAKNAGVAQAAIDKLLNAKKVKDYEKQLEFVNLQIKAMEQFGGKEKFVELATAAGVTQKQLDALFNAKSAKEYEAHLEKITAEIKLHQQLTDAQAQRQQLLNAAVQRYGFQINEIGPLLKKQQMAEHAEQLLTDWQLLTEAGVEVENVVDRMGGSASEFIARAKEFGIEVPSAMKPMLEAMIKEGQLLDENGEAYKTLEATGVTFGETLTEMFKGVLQKLDELIAKLTEASKPRSAQVDIYERYHRDEEGRGGREERMHSGGYVRRAHTGLAIDEVPIIAQAGEGIVSRSGMRRIGVAGLHSINNGGGGMAAAPITIGQIVVRDDSDASAKKVGRQIIKEMKRRGVRFNAA